ncbi:phage head closure protein [Rickettsia endosymbiont of Cardiosporidium cionae]|uniref:phage head closure protein n=1 Tax=Rickettsia endosymbiont of Cardiosporidium cionae TaxID=2777155 RepID=UPI0018949D25|nr:phage head closure protein [Rickettsia endosymbiont of Cardiosporidium cionae]KAF8818804.1 head-tail adaptor protein [Rickettsia endosymbiont of Cardiosporidium cionae]
MKYNIRYRNKNLYKSSIAATLSQKITFLIDKNKDDFGQEKWQEYFYCFAHMDALCNNSYYALNNLKFGYILTKDLFLFRLRYNKNINRNLRISFESRIFSIKRVINIGSRSKLMSIIAIELM